MPRRSLSDQSGWILPDAIIHLLGKSILNEYYSFTKFDTSRYGVTDGVYFIRERYDLSEELNQILSKRILSCGGPKYVEFLEEKGREIWKRLYRKVSTSLVVVTAIHDDNRIEITKDISERVVSLDIWRNTINTSDVVNRDVIIFPKEIPLNNNSISGPKNSGRRGRPPTHDWDVAIDEFLCRHIREAEFETASHLKDEFSLCFPDQERMPDESTIRKELGRRFPKFYARTLKK